MEYQPKVSIIIPVYNGSNYLKEAIDSALAQTYKNIEVIVINDGSNDNGKTERIAMSYENKIRYINKPNGGVASALNVGIQEMKGEYFSWLSHDDVYYPTKIEKQIHYIFDNDLKKTIIYTDYDLIDETSKVIGKYKAPYIKHSQLQIELLKSHPIHGCTLLIPKLCFMVVGLFNEKLKTTQDYDMWFRLTYKFEFHHVPLSLIKSRQHSEQGSKTIEYHLRESNQFYIDYMKEFSIYELQKSLNIKHIELFFAEMAIIYKRKGYMEASNYALEIFEKSLGNNNYNFEKLSEKEKIIIFGAGKFGSEFYNLIINSNRSISYFVDNDNEKWGKKIRNILISPPSRLSEENKEEIFIIISSDNYLEIGNQLIKLGFKKDQFCTLLDLKL
ncbi:glycosyltransferase [Bacillus sp. CGMCC 1.16607]|uniref:glycosyltransferase n=1 Tax=Bacillus sp. CGMCC 1.16607 TaxID=3351842 RepID=UPI0036391557